MNTFITVAGFIVAVASLVAAVLAMLFARDARHYWMAASQAAHSAHSASNSARNSARLADEAHRTIAA